MFPEETAKHSKQPCLTLRVCFLQGWAKQAAFIPSCIAYAQLCMSVINLGMVKRQRVGLWFVLSLYKIHKPFPIRVIDE